MKLLKLHKLTKNVQKSKLVWLSRGVIIINVLLSRGVIIINMFITLRDNRTRINMNYISVVINQLSALLVYNYRIFTGSGGNMGFIARSDRYHPRALAQG